MTIDLNKLPDKYPLSPGEKEDLLELSKYFEDCHNSGVLSSHILVGISTELLMPVARILKERIDAD